MIVVAPANCSQARELLTIGKRIRGKMYTMHTFALPFKDSRLRSQIPTCAFTFTRTSDQFCSSWRLGPNHTPWVRLSLQWKGPGRRMAPLQAPNSRPSLLSKFILAPAICSYLTITFTASMSEFSPSPLSLQSEDIEKRGQGQPFRTDYSITKDPERYPFTCTTARGL